MFVYNGSSWDILNPVSAAATAGATTFNNSTGDLVTVTFTPKTERVLIIAHYAGGFSGTGVAGSDYRLQIYRDSTPVGATSEGDITNAPQETSGALVHKDTGLTAGTEYTWRLKNIALGSSCHYSAASIYVVEVN
jgi:hypothetical protein